MALNRLKIQSSLLFISHFLNFAGYYAFLLILSNVGLIAFSRGLTIPIRVLILGCLCCIILVNRKVYVKSGARLFLLFAACYITRIIIEMLRMKTFHLDTSEYFLYFIAFGALPLLILSSLRLREQDYNVIKWSLLVSCFLLSVLTLAYYRSLIGTVGRISAAIARDENYISPLALSYCGTLSIGIGINYLLENRAGFRSRLLVLVFIAFSLVPFFLGASRGSIFSLFVPFMVMFLSKGNIVASVRMLFIMLIVAVAGIYLGELFGSSVLNRFLNIGSDIAQNNSSAIRLEMWKAGFNQFLDNPVFGNSLEVDAFQFYPHNIVIEVLLTTGIIGFIPFAALIINGFKRAVFIFRNDPRNGWIGILFIQSFIQNMFSGSIYGASWLWVSLGLLYSFGYVVKQDKNSITWYN